MRLFVGNLPFGTAEADLRRHFEACGNVGYVRIPVKPENGEQKGFAFVEMTSNGEVAIAHLNGVEFGGRALRISEAESQDRSPYSGGNGGAGGYGRAHRATARQKS